MRRTMEDLWYGNIVPWEKCGMQDSRIKELLRLVERNREDLRKELNEHQKELLGKYTDHTDEYLCLSMRQAFCDGFGLAAKLLTEALG